MEALGECHIGPALHRQANVRTHDAEEMQQMCPEAQQQTTVLLMCAQ